MTAGEVDIDEEEEVSRDAVGPDIEVAMNMYSVHTKYVYSFYFIIYLVLFETVDSCLPMY